MTSSPGSTNAIKALSIPSFAPVVIVTSVSGSIPLPKNGEYASAIAFFNRGRPCAIVICIFSIQYFTLFQRYVNKKNTHTYLSRSILVAVDPVQRLFRGVDDELGRVVAALDI